MSSDIDRKMDELLAKYQIGFVVGDKDVNEHIAKFKQALLALINEARVDELEHLKSANDDWGIHYVRDNGATIGIYDRIAELKPDTTPKEEKQL